ncbi:protein mono-ADP-ribosyltransferase PARP14-like [Mugil cephalus]|uniref:protein mono-ADP-ribosyltransferase PARP14-like n=1 Tax=Mugil cephalus TaxID=48193 RepID=UPI001FB75CE5|nr:protein mono-ADP-ribosyltransferase PARP14-like [Mugil cephalus]
MTFSGKDQQRVLKKTEHVVALKSGSLVLTVRGSLGPDPSLVAGSDAGQLHGPELESQHPLPPPNLPTSSEEYKIRLDHYLLRYLKECHKAKEELEEKLASVACSVQYYQEEEKVLVRRLAQSGAADETGDWKAQVHKLFDGYICHYETDAHKVKALLQSCSSQQSTDEVKVYTELAIAVVVGECAQVKARLMDILGPDIKRKGSRLIETSVRRLGEAKLRLLWKEIEDNLGQKIPGLNVKQGDAGQLVLEGPVEEIVEAGELIYDIETSVLEKILSDTTPHFLTFLRNVYGGPGVLGKLLGVGDDVEVEIRDTGVYLFSLFADKLDEAEKKMQEEFKDIKCDVPNCSIVPPELREMLKTKTNEMNREQCRAQVVFGSDSRVCLLGHTKEVEELNDTVIQFILDHASIQGKVILPFTELMQLLPELLQLQKIDYTGVTFHPLTSSSKPMLGLEGPSSKVTEVRNRLGPLLDSLVQHKITIDLPGALQYFESHSGKQSILRVAQSHKCLMQVEEQPQAHRHNAGVAKYNLQDGLQVLVCQGDITQQYADALVNAANEDLDHVGGVAAALSKAGGPQVQKESKALVKQTGKIPTGEVVVTTGGNLKCKKLLHAVGPVAGKPRGRERMLLEKTVQGALNLAEMMEFKSIAMPCISSGIFGVPLNVCSEAIVTAVKEFGSQGGRSLSKIILIDNRSEVVRAMQAACDRLLQGRSSAHSTASHFGMNVDAVGQGAPRGATAGAPGGIVHVEIVQGTIETQEVDALVSPMLGHDPLSTRVGNALVKEVGPKLTEHFHKEAGGATKPGDIVLVEGLPTLKSKAVVFLNQICWDKQGTAAQVLRKGIKNILASCVVRGFSSVAFPMLGTGAILHFPHNMASRILLEEVGIFEQNRASRSPFLVRFVIHPSDKESTKAFQSAQKMVQLKGYTSDANPDQVSFYRCISTTNDEVTAMLSGVKLQMVQGDIINAGTDVIVNTTNFSDNNAGVSKAILTAAGPTIQAELAKIGTPVDLMCTTGPGLLGCREIIHANFKQDTIRDKCKKILKQCEGKGYHSVAFPAIGTGMGGMDSTAACKAMLDGMASAICKLKPNSLALIRIVIVQQPVFKAFRTELENRFGQISPCRLSLKERAKQMLRKLQDKPSRNTTSSSAQGKASISSKPQPAVINVISCGSDVVKIIQRDLEEMLQKQLVERTVDAHHFLRLDAMHLDAVLAKVSVLGINIEHKSSEAAYGSRAGNIARAEAKAQSQSGQDDVYVLKGLKEDVLSVTDLINREIQKVLCEDIKDKEEAVLALTIQWSIKDINGAWQELNLHDNYVLEEAHMKKQDSVDVVAPDGMVVSVNLKKQEAVNRQTGITYPVKRIESQTALELPDTWEPMHDEVFKKVELQPNSPEYQTVAAGFKHTTKYDIVKIERVQNLYQWHAYSLFKQRILAKNGVAEIGEKSLYHGTSAESCDCIEKGTFDRSFAGTHAAMFGKGVYFAVNADYSAKRYSPADSSGLKRVFVALVLTGRYTLGSPNKKTADGFDSLVDNQQKPSMFVIFHDDQAYPQYLITFK